MAGAVATIATVFLVGSSTVLAEPPINAALRALNIVSAFGVGAVTWTLRPRSRLGPLLIVIGLLYAASSLQASADPVLHNTGRLVLPLSTLLLFYTSLAFPTGRIERRGEHYVMWGVTAAMVVAWTIEAVSAPQPPGLEHPLALPGHVSRQPVRRRRQL